MFRAIMLGLIIIAVFISGPVNAAEISVSSMRELIVLGLKNNLGLEIEKMEVLKSQNSVVIEDAIFDSEFFADSAYQQDKTPIEPNGDALSDFTSKTYSAQVGVIKKLQTGMTASLSLNTQRISDNDLSNDLDPYSRSSFVIELSQPLLRNFSTEINTTQRLISENQSRQTALSYLLQAQNLTLLLESAVRQLAGEANVVELRKKAEKLAADLYQANRKRFDAGLVPVSEVQEAETALADRQLSLSLAMEQYALHKEDLNRQLHSRLSHDFSPAALVSGTTDRPWDSVETELLITEARQKRLEFKISEFELDNSLLNKKYQLNQRKPQLDLTAQAGLNGLAGSDRGNFNGTTYQGTWIDSFSSLSERDGYQWGIGLSFSIPLGNRAAEARVRQAEYQRKQDLYQLRDLETQVRDQLEQQQIQLTRSYEQLLLAERFAELAQKTLNQEQRRLDEGLSDTFRMISFQDKMIEAQIGKVNATTRYQSALAAMAFLRGDIFQRHGIVLTENSQEINFENM